ncbi:MAG TPA: ankyrin repeat domain-containing protein [Spirochaetota bacterium]|nr:ankyrin repeat domain-containing protein [Spirochaetota bacterium]
MKKIIPLLVMSLTLCGLCRSGYANEQQLIRAAQAGNLRQVQGFLGQGFTQEITDASGRNLLMISALYGRINLLEFFIGNRANAGKQDNKGNNVLHVIAERPNRNTAKLIPKLIRAGSILTTKNYDGHTPAGIAIIKNNAYAFTAFLESGLDINAREMNMPLVMFAYSKRRANFVTALIGKGADLSGRDSEGNTFLHSAAGSNDISFTGKLIAGNADINAVNNAGKTPLMTAIEGNASRTAVFLIDKGADVNRKDRQGQTVVHFLAGMQGGHALIGKLPAGGLEIDSRDNSGRTPLSIAVSKDRWDNVEYLAKKGANVEAADPSGSTVLLRAAEKGSYSTVSSLIDLGADVNRKNNAGTTCAHILAKSGNRNAVNALKKLLEKNARINERDNDGRTPGGFAIDAGNGTSFKLLLEGGMDPNIMELNRVPLVMYGYQKRGSSVAALIADKGADLKKTDNLGNTILHNAAEKNDFNFTKYILEKNVNINAKNEAGKTPLMAAIDKGGTRVAVELIDKGAHLDVKDNNGSNIFHYLAGMKGASGLLASITKKGVNSGINEKDDQGRTPLSVAVHENQAGNVEFFLSNNADVQGKDHNGNDLLVVAVENRSLPVVQMLLGKGAKADIRDRNGKHVLQITIEKNRHDIFQALLQAGANANLKDGNGRTLLHHAADADRTQFLKILLDNNADVNAADNGGVTPLMLASGKGHTGSAAMLCGKGADASKKDEKGETAVLKAVSVPREGGLGAVTILANSGADLNAVNNSGEAPLHRAIKQQHYRILELLLKKGANANVQNSKGETVLMELARTDPPSGTGSARNTGIRNNREAVRVMTILLKNGVDPNIMNKYGHSALNLARVNKNFDIINTLLANGADVNLQDRYGNTVLKKTVMDYIGDYRMVDRTKTDMQKMITLFLGRGANINDVDKFGRTALSHAVKEMNSRNRVKVLDVIPFLISKGARTDLRDRDQKSAIDYAREGGDSELISLLR